MSENDLLEWLVQAISEETGLSPSEIDTELPFDEYKLDSLSLVTVCFNLENHLNRQIDPSAFTEFNNIRKLTRWLTETS